MKYALLTNLGCETEFSKLDNRIKACGGSTSIQTLSRKNVIVSNGLLINSDFESKSTEEKQKSWKWARCSPEVKRVKKLEADFLATVHAAKKMALLKKEHLKKKKTEKTFGILQNCIRIMVVL